MMQQQSSASQGLAGPQGPAPIAVTLPDGKRREFPGPVTGAEIAAAIGPGLAKAAIAIRVDGRPRDLAAVSTTTRRSRSSPAIRPRGSRSCATTPPMSWPRRSRNFIPRPRSPSARRPRPGFYYDFARAEPFTPEDLEKIEARMRDDRPPRRADHPRGLGPRRGDCLLSRASASATRPNISARSRPDEEISLYRQGDFVDLCVGPHLPSTGHLGQAFKLMNVAGAYWRGDAQQRAAAARLRHRLGQPEGPRPIPLPARRGRAPRPSPARPRARPVSSQRGGGRQRLLAPEGLDAVPHHRELHARAGSTRPATRRSRARNCSTAACGRLRAIGRIFARTCSSPRAATSGCSRSSR